MNKFIQVIVAFILLNMTTAISIAQPSAHFPNKPIQIIVPVAAGGVRISWLEPLDKKSVKS